MGAGAIATNDRLIFDFLEDQNFKVLRDGRILRRTKLGWKECGSLNHTRNKKKVYWKISYRGKSIYAHRVVWAKFKGFLSEILTVNHKDLDGLNNRVSNLELISASENRIHAIQSRAVGYRRGGMSAAEAKAAWRRGS